ncbi:MAG: hypothetical protein ACLFN7_05035, partial [Candidatus Acetothermia bacterium]
LAEEGVKVVVNGRDKEKLFSVLEKSLSEVKQRLGFDRQIQLDETSILGEADMGKYHCPMCQKFFEFNVQKETVTCPFMAQKCMATPTNIEKMNYDIDSLIKIYKVTPDIYRRMIREIYDGKGGFETLGDTLQKDWDFEFKEAQLERVGVLLGLQ